jgi:hypothetical protein
MNINIEEKGLNIYLQGMSTFRGREKEEEPTKVRKKSLPVRY